MDRRDRARGHVPEDELPVRAPREATAHPAARLGRAGTRSPPHASAGPATELAALAEKHDLPAENLLSPD